MEPHSPELNSPLPNKETAIDRLPIAETPLGTPDQTIIQKVNQDANPDETLNLNIGIDSKVTEMDEDTARKILGSDLPATNAEKIAAATQYPGLADHWGWTKTDIDELRGTPVDSNTENAIANEINTLLEKVRRVSADLSPEESKLLIAEIQNSLPLLSDALKQDYFYSNILDLMSSMGVASIVGDAPELNDLRCAFVEQNLEVMIQAATRDVSINGEAKIRARTISAMKYVISMGSENQRAQMLSCLDSHRAEWIQSPGDIEIFRSYFEGIFEHGSIEQRMNAANIVLSFFNNEDPDMKEAGIKMMKAYYEKFSDKPYPARQIKNPDDPIYQQVTETIGQYVPDLDDLIQKTLFSGPLTKESLLDYSDNLGERLVKSMETILLLEQQRPGICQTLRKEFGIRNFYRYSPDILISQYDNRGTPSERGIAAVALYDHNGALSSDSSQQARNGLFTQLQDEQTLGKKYGLMIYEIGDSRELVRAVANARRKTPNKKLSFGIIDGHGTEDSIQFGDYFIGRIGFSTISSSDMENPITPSIAGAFEEGAPILFSACSTGQGIVKEASKLGLKVSGPTQDTSIKSYTVSSQEGHLNIEAEWTSDKATYLSGVKI